MALLPVEEALQRLLKSAQTLSAEDVGLDEAAGRVLAMPVKALRTQPPFPASAMDGYAVRAADIASIPAQLRVIGIAPAGHGFSGTVGAGECVRIFTGAPVPQGADTILIQEDARVLSQDRIEALASETKGRHVRPAGLDFSLGDAVLEAGRELDAAALSLAAAANNTVVPVIRRPRVAILATGDELVVPGSEPGPDQIIASNNYGVAAIARQAGADVVDLGIAPDEPAAIRSAVETALAVPADVIVTLGGASVGDHDLVQDVLTEAGMTLDFWKIAMRPGKPLMVGRFGACHVLGLPGNPVSSLVCSHLFLKPLLARLSGRLHRPELRRARLAVAMGENDQRQDYLRAVCRAEGGELSVTPFARQDSSMLKTLADANCLAIRPPFAPPAEAGTPIDVLLLREIAAD